MESVNFFTEFFETHPEGLAAFIDQHAQEHCAIVLVDPGRGLHARFSKRMVGFGYAHTQRIHVSVPQDIPFHGKILFYQR